MPYRRPGWPLPNGHIVRSNMEAALCDYLSKAVEPHVHHTLSFDVPTGQNKFALYVPSIILTHSKKDDRTIIIEPVDSARPGGGVRRLQGFRRYYSEQHFIIVVARRALHDQIPENAYHVIFPLDDFASLDEFLRGL